jgi:hypothetical protein
MGQRFVVTEVHTVDGIFTNAHQRVMSLNEAVKSTPGVWWDGTSNLDALLALEVEQFTSHSQSVGNRLVYYYVTRIK